ncbi:putative Major facilitator superfamily domain-containing protein 9 [Hypsibius exemplaris]|uniref:Major facilitator superfamily domain-containing protein 9 n=1 Tax=Hypsibius exemplaris TaxID=2072580 RepID=A0A1W0WQH2_HYPEX|nr:putative Major facilitator superfamily domain-containing protein 9 [Hypsibius exemplaris]
MMEHENNDPSPPVRNRRGTKSTLYVVYFVAFMDLFAVSMLTPLMRKQNLDLGSSYTTAGIIGSVYGATQLFSSPLVGDWSDRLGRTYVMSLTTFLTAIGYFILAASQWLPLVFLARAICGCFKHTQTLTKAYLADLDHHTEHEDNGRGGDLGNAPQRDRPTLGESFGPFMAISTSGFVIGPIVGGHVAELDSGFQIVCLTVVVIFLFNAVIIRHLPTINRPIHTTESGSPSPRAAITFRETVVDNYDIFLLQLLVSLSILIVRTNYVQHVHDNFGISIKWAGYLTSYQALLGVLGSSCVSSRIMNYSFCKHTPTLVLYTTILLSASVVGIAYTSNLTIYILSLTVLNFMTPFSRIANLRQLLERSESPAHHGALMGTGQSVGSLCRLSSSFLSGLAQDYAQHGPEMISVACTAAALGQILFMNRSSR